MKIILDRPEIALPEILPEIEIPVAGFLKIRPARAKRAPKGQPKIERDKDSAP